MLKWAVALLLAVAGAHAADTVIHVTRSAGNSYTFTMQFVAHAPAVQVISLITDYAHLSRLNPLIKNSRILPHDDNEITRVEIVTEGCLLFFCKKIIRVEDARVIDNSSIETEFVAELSDFKSGKTTWTFSPDGQSTRVIYQAVMVPDFWLPPFVGPYLLEKQLHSQLEYTAKKINLLLLSHDR